MCNIEVTLELFIVRIGQSCTSLPCLIIIIGNPRVIRLPVHLVYQAPRTTSVKGFSFSSMQSMLLAKNFALLFFLFFASVFAVRNLQIIITNSDGKDSQIHYKIGQSLSLNCSVSVTGINATVFVIKWLKSGSFLKSSNTTNGWLEYKISTLSPSDGGYYQCEATNSRVTGSEGVFVNLQGKPHVIKCCDGVHYTKNPIWFNKAGDIKKLLCYATGWPLPDIKWLFNGSQLTPGAGKAKGTYFLTPIQNGLILQLFGILNEGIYTCQASNIYGTDTNLIKLTAMDVTGEPEIAAIKSHVTTKVGQVNTTLTCIGKHVRKLDADAIWLHNGRELDVDSTNSSRFVFNIEYYNQTVSVPVIPRMVKMQVIVLNATKADGGNYTCKVYLPDKVVMDTISFTVEKKESNKPNSHKRKTTPLAIVIPLAVVMVILLVIGIVVAIHKCRSKLDPSKIPKGPYKYGAFITYSSHDYPWVKDNLLPFLKENGIETCIHYRNFEIGEVLEQNIVNCIYRSRVVIAVISKNYMKSNYCYSELKYAIHRSLEEPAVNPLIALKIDKSIRAKRLPKAIQRKTFLDVTSEVERDTWQQRLLMHVQHNHNDQNQNSITDNIIQRENEQEALMGVESNDSV